MKLLNLSPNKAIYAIGDAAHSIKPHLAQGSAMALEDAYFLANLITNKNKAKDIHQMLKIREKRVNRVINKSSQNSIEIAKFLETKEIIKTVFHPALEQHPDHELWKKDFKGASGLFAIEFHDNVYEEAVDIIADNCKIFGIGSSWGGYSSLISMMNVSESRNIKTSYIPKGVYLRIYTGSENINDLLNDFKNGIKILRKFLKL